MEVVKKKVHSNFLNILIAATSLSNFFENFDVLGFITYLKLLVLTLRVTLTNSDRCLGGGRGCFTTGYGIGTYRHTNPRSVTDALNKLNVATNLH